MNNYLGKRQRLNFHNVDSLSTNYKTNVLETHNTKTVNCII